MIIDPSKQAATFLRYRDTNYLNCCNPRDMEPEVIRMALLGSIRYMYVQYAYVFCSVIISCKVPGAVCPVECGIILHAQHGNEAAKGILSGTLCP